MSSPLVRLLSGLLLLSCIGTLHAQSPTPQPSAPPIKIPPMPGVRQVFDVPYVTGGHEAQKLDLYIPENTKSALPLLVYIHGGGWAKGDKKWFPGKGFTTHGYVVASLNYRLSQDAVFPAQIEDCKAAIRFLRAHASEYKIQGDRVGVWGDSAGGHLVALLGTTGDIRDFDTGANLDQPSKVQCVVDWYGPTDFLHIGDKPDPARDTPGSAVGKLLGGTIRDNPDKARRASPIYYVNKDTAPFLIMHGDNDKAVPLQQSQIFEEALKKAGIVYKLVIIPGAKHADPVFRTESNMSTISQFLDTHLKQ